MKYKHGEYTKQKILYAAFELFAEQGYSSTSIVDIMQKIGLTKGGFYNHYGSKKELLFDVIHYFYNREVLLREPPAPENLIDWVVEQANLQRKAHSKEVWKKAYLEIRANMKHDSYVQETMSEVYQKWLVILTDLTKQAQRAGVIRQDHTSEDLAEMIIVTFDGFMMTRHILESSCVEDFRRYLEILLKPRDI